MPPTSDTAPGLALSTLVARLGGGLAEVVVAGTGPIVDDVALADGEGGVGVPGDLLLAPGLTTPDHVSAVLARMTTAGVEAFALRRSVATDPAVAATATQAGVAVVAIADGASWAHLAWLVRETLDRAAAAPTSAAAESDDLFALADACAQILGAPVTVEDTQSRVVAYSELHEGVDPIRVSTILGRRAPAQTVAALRSQGVFRHLVRSDEPLFVPAEPERSRGARHIIPAKVGDEWVGSIWAAVDEPLPADRLTQVRDVVRLVALHLLRLRTESELGRRLAEQRVRAALAADGSAAAGLPEPPWRVVVLGTDLAGTPDSALALWESVLRRSSWRRPLLADVDGDLVAVVGDSPGESGPGSWAWLGRVVADVARRQRWARASAGQRVEEVAALAGSLAAAREVAALRSDDARADAGPVASSEDAWAEIVVRRAVAGLREQPPSPPFGLAGLDPVLVETLRTWLDHPANTRACAAALHVHPNTVRYRMGRIREALDVDLADPTVRLALALLTRVDHARQ